MKKFLNTLFFFFLISIQLTFSQEWKNIKEYEKTTGTDVLKNGCWLKKDRKQKDHSQLLWAMHKFESICIGKIQYF